MLILCGCSKQAEPPSATTDFPEPEEVILWIPEGHTDLVTELCKDYTDLHPEKRYALILNEITEQEITAAAMKSESAPDVLFLPSGSLPSLAAAGVLSKADINAINSDKSALDSAMFAGRLLAYPCAAECCILFYDRSVFNEEDAESLYAIMQKDTEKQANLAADLNSADVLCSFFLGAGCTLDKPESFSS